MQKRFLTIEQKQIVDDFVFTYGLDQSQISFEGSNNVPIFDYEALNLLRLKLTDIQSVEFQPPTFNQGQGIITVSCLVTLPDGRTTQPLDSAVIGETMPDGGEIETYRQAQNVAQARALRRGIRSVGINLLRAHEQFKQTGKAVTGEPLSLEDAERKEIQTLVRQLGLKTGSGKNENRQEYEKFLAEQFDGRTSTKDLNEAERNRLKITLRAMKRIADAQLQSQPAAA